MPKSRHLAFTLVELIVVITILSILGTIAFLSLQGYSKNARDSVRTTDLKNIQTSLELYLTKVGKYPEPSSSIAITYSGGLAWKQGTFGNEPFKQLGDISKLPTDPLTGSEYTYSTTSNKTEYQLSSVYEGSITKNKELLNSSYAEGNLQGTTKIVGTYNGVQLYINTGSYNFTIFTPTIINGDLSKVDLQEIITNNKLSINGSSKLPDSYKNTVFKDKDVLINLGDIVISTGSLSELKAKTQSGKLLRKEYITKLQSILTGSILKNNGNYISITNLDVNSINSDLVAISLISGKGVIGSSISSTQTTNTTDCIPGQGFNGTTCVNATECVTGLESLTLSNGQTWSCINLGATTVWDGSTQPISCGNVSTNNCNLGNTWIGDYYQWGRNEPVNTTITGSAYNGTFSGLFGHNNFILGGSYGDWWQDEAGDLTSTTRWSGTNPQGPCPAGWHVPTQSDWQNACNSILSTTCSNGMAYNSLIATKLKLPFSGNRGWNNGYYSGQSSIGYYWSSTTNLSQTYRMYFSSSSIFPQSSTNTAYAFSIRCIKN